MRFLANKAPIFYLEYLVLASYSEIPIICPACRRQLGDYAQIPDSCPRCSAGLQELRQICAAAVQAYKRAGRLMRQEKFAQAQQLYENAMRLWKNDCFMQAAYFARLATMAHEHSQCNYESLEKLSLP
jgi:predicted amidophosphoribosyltransferase